MKNIVERARGYLKDWEKYCEKYPELKDADEEFAHELARALLDAVEALEWYADIPNEFSEETLEDKARALLAKLRGEK